MSSDDPFNADDKMPPPRPGRQDQGSDFADIDRSPTAVYDPNQPASTAPAPPPTTSRNRAVTGGQPAITGNQPAVSGPEPTEQRPLEMADFPEPDPEDITSTGFIPNENFKAPKKSTPTSSPRDMILKRKAKRKISVGKLTLTVPTMNWLENADPIERLQYGGGGLLAGALIGAILGILNALLQGWTIVDGIGQIFFLTIFLGIFCAILAALRPARADELFTKLGLPED